MTFVDEHRRASVRDLTRPVGCYGGFFFFAFGWRGRLFLTFKPLLLRRRRWIRPRKSGGPPLFKLSLMIQRDRAHKFLTNQSRGPSQLTGLTMLKSLATAARYRPASSRPPS